MTHLHAYMLHRAYIPTHAVQTSTDRPTQYKPALTGPTTGCEIDHDIIMI